MQLITVIKKYQELRKQLTLVAYTPGKGKVKAKNNKKERKNMEGTDWSYENLFGPQI